LLPVVHTPRPKNLTSKASLPGFQSEFIFRFYNFEQNSLDTTPILGKVKAAVAHQANWHHGDIKCQLRITEVAVVVTMKGGAEQVGHPGHGWEFTREAKSMTDALNFVRGLPETFGPDECVGLGFCKTSEVLYD
jgi:hypothetical protein